MKAQRIRRGHISMGLGAMDAFLFVRADETSLHMRKYTNLTHSHDLFATVEDLDECCLKQRCPCRRRVHVVDGVRHVRRVLAADLGPAIRSRYGAAQPEVQSVTLQAALGFLHAWSGSQPSSSSCTRCSFRTREGDYLT